MTVPPLNLRFLHPGQEWDDLTNSWVRKGWISERQNYADNYLAEITEHPEKAGTCIQCKLSIALHPLPERMWRSLPEYCDHARAKAAEH